MYLIPRNVATRFQFFPGFGLRELGITFIGAVAGAALYVLAGALHAGGVVRMLLFVVPVAATYAATRPGPDGASLLDLVRRWRAFGRRQRLYIYVCGRWE